MPLRVLTGTANAGKTGVIHARLREHVAEGGRALLLLPSPPDVARAMIELAPHCPVGLEITTLGSHLDACWRVVGDGRQLVTTVQRAIVLEESGRTVDPGCLGGSAGTPGFRRMLSSLVQRAAEVELLPHATDGRSDDPGACLMRFIHAYFHVLGKAGLVERAEAYRAVAEKSDQLDSPGLLAVNRFTGLTGPQERYIVASAQHTDVLIALTFSPLLPATEAAGALVSRLSEVGVVEEVAATRAYSEAGELVAIERGFSAERADRLASSGAVIVSEAWGRASEAARIVAEIQSAQRTGIEPGSIAVVLRDPSAHMRVLRRALDEAGMPANWDVQIPFERTGLGRAVLGLLSVCAGTADRATWMDLMRSPYSPLSLEELDEFDARIRRLGVGGTEATRRLDSWLRGEAADFMRQARSAATRVADEESVGRWHGLAMQMIGCAHPGGAMLSPEGMLDAAAARALVDAVGGLQGLPYERATVHILGTALRGTPVSVGGDTDHTQVQVMSAERVRGRRFACVILGGLTADEFPRIRRDEGYGALGAEVALARAGIDTAPRDDVAAERLLFYQVITRARSRLVLSRRSHDDNGQPVQPSVFLEELLDLYECGGDEHDTGSRIAHTVLGLDLGCSGADSPCTTRRTERSAAWGLGARLTGADDAAGPAADARHYALSDETRAVLRARETFSVSDIEVYLQCPYRWFIERVIRPSDLDTRIDASTAGQAAHEVLAVLYERFIAATGESRITPETLDTALELLPAVFDEVLTGVHTESAREAAELQRALRSTARILAADATLLPGYHPRHREWSFGMSEGDHPEPVDGYSLRGRIDRIDCSSSHLLITDYKLGAVGPERGVAKFAENGLVQLPLYAYVASKRLGLDVAGAVYRSITRGDLRGFVTEGLRGKPFVSTDVVSGGEVEAIIDFARERASEAVAGMRAGAITAAPSDGRCSPYCAARSFCPGRGEYHA
ncbi:MAG: PD-(D/E)XK nuclease family protein [Coriobacteriia bacterium]